MSRMTAPQPTAAQRPADPFDSQARSGQALAADDVIAALLFVVIGDGKKDHGQLSRKIAGSYHLESCQYGMWIQAGDSLRGGQPCSPRCQTAQIAAEWACAWLRAHRPPAGARQVRLEMTG